MTEWRADILGVGFECTDIALGEDHEGQLGATLVRSLPAKQGFWRQMFHGKRRLEGARVLYVHGWSDYFFQRQLAEHWTAQGATFYALDLRKYGRSLRDGQTAGYVEDLEDYDHEIDAALEIMRFDAGEEQDSPNRNLILLGHSTGGLVLSLWAARHPGGCDAIVLNSPWLELQLASAGRHLLAPLIELGARVNARDVLPQLDTGNYARAQREVGLAGEYDTLDTTWRPDRSHPVLTGWLRAVTIGHARVSAGLQLDVPVTVLLSERSTLGLRWHEGCLSSDTVLEVDAVARAALKLGTEVTVVRIDGALHDVFLSAPQPRQDAYAALDRWAIGWAAQRAAVRGTRR